MIYLCTTGATDDQTTKALWRSWLSCAAACSLGFLAQSEVKHDQSTKRRPKHSRAHQPEGYTGKVEGLQRLTYV